MKKLVKALSGVISIGVILLLSVVLYIQYALPDYFYVAQGEEYGVRPRLSLTFIGKREVPIPINFTGGDLSEDGYNLDLKLFESVPIKQVQVRVVPRSMVIPGGNPFGIKMHTQGVVVVGLSDIQNGAENHNPAKDAGIKVGDVLLSAGDVTLENNEDLLRAISESEGDEVKICLIRDGREMDFYLKPVKSDLDEGYKAGIWVRDSSAGIGTMTYFDPETMRFAGLGHGICDVDTGEIMPLSTGEIVDVNITGASVGHSGRPGELKGTFVGQSPIGRLLINSGIGIYGILHEPNIIADPVPMALRQEVLPGPATILTTVSGNKPQSFDITIEKVNYSDTVSSKNMVIKVVDPGLLAATGGIVQGMSGSPILQDGKLVGAVTHVFVNDPTRGYGIFAENMDKQLKKIEDNPVAA